MGSKVFEGVSYYLAEKSMQEPAEVKQLLRQGSAVREFYMSDLVTHIITDGPLDPSTTVNPDITIIHSDWVKMSMKCEVMLPAPFELSDDKLFSGLVFCPSKLSRSDTEKLCVLVAYYGGRMQRRLDPSVTHLVTMETTGAKYECAVKHSDTIKIVTPDWVLDCIDLGKRLAVGDYHPSPSPPTTGESPCNDSRGIGGNVTQGGVTSPEFNGEMETNVRTNQPDKQEVVSSCTSGAGVAAGVVDLPVEEERVLDLKLPAVKEGEEGDSPEPGGREGTGKAVVESVGELRIRVKLNDQVTSVNEADKSTTLPGSNTSGLPQAELEKLSPTLKTTPATPHPELPPPLLQGTTFFFTDYQDCMDNETIATWREVVVQHGGRVLEEYDPEQCTHVLALHKKSNVFDRALEDEKCIASAHWLNDILTDQKMYPPRRALHFPTAFKWQLPGARDYSITLTNYMDVERELVKDMIRITGIPYTGFLCRETTHLVCRRAVGKKYSKAVEWGVHVVNASFLTDIIHNGKVPTVLFPQYTTLECPDEFSPNTCLEAARLLKPWETFMSHYTELHPGLVNREATQSSLQATPSSLQATPSSLQATTSSSHKRGRGQGTGGNDGDMKKLKLSSDRPCCDENQSEQVPVPPVVLFTGISQPVVKKLKSIVQRLGGVMTDRAGECTHIVATRITRTVKFLCGISVCEHVVTPEWVEESERRMRFVEEAEFSLCDRDAEETFGMDLAASLARAKEKKLLEGLCFFSTLHVQPPRDSLREIIECAGGELLSRSDVDGRFGEQLKNLPSSTEQFIVISCPDDVDSDHCSEFFRHGIAVYNAEFVLTGVLKQELDFSQYPLKIKGSN